MAREITSATMDEVASIYKDTESIKETALRMEMSQVKVRKILLTCGLWSSPRSIEIGRLLAEGKTVKEVAAALGITPVSIQAYMPYEKGLYGEPDKSDDAVRADQYRKRQKKFKKAQIPDEAVQDFWGMKRSLLELAGIDVGKNETADSDVADADAADSNDKKENMKLMNAPKTKKNNPADLALPIMYRIAPCDHSGDVFRLKLELIGSDKKSLSPEDWKILHKYGSVEKSISREILVSRHSTLRAVHFMLQMLFGWQHSHLHEFEFCDEDFLRLLSHDNTPALNYLNTCGVYFRFPIVDFDDDDWDDDYEEGMSGKTWMRSKYKELRDFPGVSEEWKENQRKISDFREWLKGKYGVAEDGTERIYIRPDFYEEFLAKGKGGKLEGKMISLKECTVDELLRTVRGVEDPNPSALREHLHLAEVLATGVTALTDENGQYEIRAEGGTIDETMDRDARNVKKTITYLPKVSEYFYGPMRTEVGIEKDSDLESTWALIGAESDEGLEDAESYRKDVLAFQKLMRDNGEHGRHEDDNWQPEGFREAFYKWQRHFMDSPFNPGMDQYYIPPVATTLYYHYDFGDSWRVRITVEDVYSLEENWEDSSVLADGGESADVCALDEKSVRSIKSWLPKGEDALWFGKDRKYIDGKLYAQVLSVYRSGRPLCVAKDGLDVLDDVGGVSGYINFLQELHEGAKGTRIQNREWARGQGWTGRNRKPEKML